MKPYPLFADIENRAVLVVGGGEVAARKVRRLLESGALVTVVAPEAGAELREMEEQGLVTVRRRAYSRGDLEGCILAFAATDDPEVNGRVAGEAHESGILVNRIDGEAESGSFTVPSVVRRGPLDVAFSAGGLPLLVKSLGEYFRGKLYPELAGEIEELLAERRGICGDPKLSRNERREMIEDRLGPKIEHIIEKIEAS